MDSNHEDLLISFKKLHGKDEKDELTLDDIGDITLTYEDTYESYIENAVREHFEEQQEKAVAQAFLKKMDKLLGGAEFSDALRQLWGKYVLPRKDSIQDVADMQRILKQFFQRAGSSITDAQKKKLTKVSVAYRDVADQLADEGVLDPVIADRIQQKRIISLNTDAEESVKQFLRTYVKTDLVPAYAAMQAGVQDIASLYKVPGFSLALSSYDLSVQNLLKDKEFQKVFSDASATEEQKNQAQQRAAAKLISQTDKDLGKITEQLFANEYNLARLGKAEQQAYITRFASKRESSEQMKAIDTFLTSINLSAAQRKSIFDQLFNLSSDKLQFEGSNGEKYTLPLQKKIIDRNWSAETLSAQMNAPLPLIFLISPSEHLDEAYLQRLTKSEDKSFSLTGADGKPMTIFPSHLIEIADRNGNKKKGYLYKDPQGKYFLLPQPGSTQREELDEKEVHASTVQLVEPTYSFEAEQVPEFMTHLLMTAEAANRTDEEMHDALQERNSDIADQTLSEEFAREDNTPPVTDSEIETINWDNNEEVAALSDERKEKLQKKIDEDLTRIAGRLQKLDKRINDQDALIKTLTQKVHVESAQKPFNQEQFDRLNNSLTKAQEERDNLLDEKNSLLAKKEKLTDAQKTLKDTQKKDDAKESEKKALSKSVETEKGFGNTWKDLSGDNTITSPLPGKSCIMVSLPDASSSLTGGGAARVRGDIVSYDPDTETMVVERHGVEGPLK